MSEQAVHPAYASALRGNATEIPMGGGKKNGRIRELIMPSSGSGKTYLKFRDERFTWYNVPLGKAATRGKDEAPTPLKNVIIPILPRVYATPDLDPAQCDVPRKGGYLYIYKNGHLWREFEVLAQGWFREVNLHKYAGRDERPATVEKDNRILVLHRINGQDQDIEMTYSEVQWSWARINQLGGMDPDDIRLHPDYLPPMPEDQGITPGKAAELREARLQKIDLSGFEDGFPVQPPEGRTAHIENVAHANDQLIHIRLHHKRDIPVVYLHDPLGVALENLEAYRQKEAELVAEIEKARQHPHYRSAVLTWQTFFNKALWKKAPRKKRQRGPSHYADTSDEAENLRKAAAEIDREFVREILRVESRRKLRRELRDLKARHFAWLRGQNPEGRSIVEEHPDFIPLEQALADHASLPREDYLQLWSTMNALLLYASHDPSALDSGHDLPAERDKPAAGDDPGKRYLADLLDPGHPLNRMLFPAPEQVDLASPEYALDPQAEDEIPAADGAFRPLAFAGAMAAARRLSARQAAESVVREGEKIVASFMLNFQHQWQAALKDASTVEIDGFLRLAKAANTPELRGMHLVAPGTSLDGKVIIDGRLEILETLRRHARREAFAKAVRQPGEGRVNVVDPRTGQAIFSQKITDVADNKGLPLAITDRSWSEIWRDTDTDGTARARGRFVAISETSEYALSYHVPTASASRSARIGAGTLKVAGKVLPPLVVVVELMNLHSSINTLFKKTDTGQKERIRAGIALLAFLYATVDAPLKIAGETKGAEFWARAMPRERWRSPTKRFLSSRLNIRTPGRTIQIRTLGTIGAGVSAAGAIMAGWDAFEAFSADDADAAAAYGVQAVAGIALAACELGAATISGAPALAALGPWGWAALAVFLTAGIVATLLQDTPVEKWAKHGPFARDAKARGTHEYSRIRRDESGRPVLDQNGEPEREPLPPEKMYEALMSLLMAPGVTIKRDSSTVPPTVLVDVVAPGFEPGRSSINVLATVGTEYRMSPAERATAIRNGFIDVSAMESWTAGAQVPLKLREWSPRYAEDGLTQIGIRYRFAYPEMPTGGGERRFTTLRARTRHVTADQLIIPTIPDAETDVPQAAPNQVDPDIPGWAYAGPVNARP